jgi:hypothetical protein
MYARKMISPRKRILSLLAGEKTDRVPWFGDMDYWAFSLIKKKEKPPDFIQSPEYIEWHRDLNVGFYLQGYFPFKPVPDFEERSWREGNRRLREWITPKGTLRESWIFLPQSFSEAPEEHFVKRARDLEALGWAYDHMDWIPDFDPPSRRLEQVGDQGIVLCYLPKSPFMQLAALEAGIASLSFLAADVPEELLAALEAMKRSFDRAVDIVLRSPADALMIPENLSSEAVGARMFDKYIKSHQKEWVNRIRDSRKYSFIHMDGTLKGLLKEEAYVGFDVIEAMTPAPVGDLGIRDWASTAGTQETIFWGGLPGSYLTPLVEEAEFERHVLDVLSVMRRKPRYVLGVADQVPPDGLESRVRRVGELVDLFGRYE